MKKFETDTQRIRFARSFIDHRLSGFKKDIRACLTPDPYTGKHAYFPALITCIAMLELMSGLYKGNIGHIKSFERILYFRSLFMDKTIYSPLIMKVLYSVMRHKIAHLSHPYMITDTRNEPNLKSYGKKMRITWYVTEESTRPAIELFEKKGTVTRSPRPPWPVIFDHVLLIHLKSFSADIVSAVNQYEDKLIGVNNYLLRHRFEKAILHFYQ